ncbi:unnamed protein product [Cochlearia groenlandica]
MANQPTSSAFDDLHYGFCSQLVVGRLIHCWEEPIFQGEKAIGLELLFIDAKGQSIHSFIAKDDMPNLEQKIRPNSIYKFNHFMVVTSRMVHRVSSNSLCIFEELYDIVDEHKNLLDIIGVIRIISTDMSDPNVSVPTGILYQDRVFLHLQLEKLGDIMEASLLTDASSAITILETVTIGKLYQFLQAGTRRVATLLCIATIDNILEDTNWYYISCSIGKRKLTMVNPDLVCPRFRFEASVSDDTGNATFVVFDKEGETFAQQTAATMIQDIIANNGGVVSLNFIPKCFKAIVVTRIS